ncbi:DNA-binding protein [Enterococcus nangangensis]|uniref:DNA-binding protein n=1 Tax=Enterococcus nangangensis TaxID=2559926 RepID=UPI0010F6FCA5|nr:DNA-binding protein [Enterococcus nangangensis]
MNKDLTESYLDRQNILNNKLAIKEAEDVYKLNGLLFEGVQVYSNAQIAEFFEVDLRTIERIIESDRKELEKNGLMVLTGKKLAQFKDAVSKEPKADIAIGANTRSFSVSTFRTILNFSMLIKSSEKARLVRSRILDIVLDVLTKKTDGKVKYINQRDASYLDRAFAEESERKKFTQALNLYVDMNQYKYAFFTDEIYRSIFRENTKEYRNILSLAKRDNARATMYSEVLLLIASYEAGIAYEIEKESSSLGRMLTRQETLEIVDNFANHPAQKPLIEDVRLKMASRDHGFRNAYHEKMAEYIRPISENDYEKFLGDQSKALEEQIEEHRAVFERLRDK